jgi:hypothetical protein
MALAATPGTTALRSMRAALDSTGVPYITVEYDNSVRKVGTNGIITTTTGNGQMPGFEGDGGSSTVGQLNAPQCVAVDSSGNLYISDSYSGRVRKISAGGISVVAGCGTGDGGLGAFAELVWPTKIAIDKQGSQVSDTYGHRVRKIAPNRYLHRCSLRANSPENGSTPTCPDVQRCVYFRHHRRGILVAWPRCLRRRGRVPKTGIELPHSGAPRLSLTVIALC